MQPLYVVEFDVSAAPGVEVDVAGRLRAHLASWLDGNSGLGPTVEELTRSGEVTLPARPPGRERRSARWAVAGGDGSRAVRVHLSHPVDSGALFLTQVTLADLAGSVVLRVALGQEIPSGWLAPIEDPPLYRPNLLGRVGGDKDLRLHTLGRPVSDRFEAVRRSEDVPALVASLTAAGPLPTLLVHPRDEDARALVRRASSQLLGLARVVALNYAGGQELVRALPRLRVPDGGALLVWPQLTLAHPRFTRAELADPGVVERWTRTLAGLSVLARGSDRGWGSARQAGLRDAARRADARLAEARHLGGLKAANAELQRRVRELEAEAGQWEELALAESARADEYAGLAADAAQSREEATRWRELWEQERATGQAPPPADPWQEIPPLDHGDAGAVYRALEAASGGRVVFTPGAERSWKAIRYRHPDEMREQLILLAKAAADLYEESTGPMPHLDEWFSTEHGLRVATSDQTLKKDQRKRYAEFEGAQWDTLPHVKVRDGVAHSECGRIHFALDPKGRRFVVDHVGVKKY
ncbi:hypothetical protein ACN20G_15215 [Streptomyces sp. BI20]|uniref:hypothetical protein n=1 Tax=Streptomyces sp. BI20 TaxID=3403460 RepID=UPI003C72909E